MSFDALLDWRDPLYNERGEAVSVLWPPKPGEVVYVKFSGERYIYAYNFDGTPTNKNYPKLVTPNV